LNRAAERFSAGTTDRKPETHSSPVAVFLFEGNEHRFQDSRCQSTAFVLDFEPNVIGRRGRAEDDVAVGIRCQRRATGELAVVVRIEQPPHAVHVGHRRIARRLERGQLAHQPADPQASQASGRRLVRHAARRTAEQGTEHDHGAARRHHRIASSRVVAPYTFSG